MSELVRIFKILELDSLTSEDKCDLLSLFECTHNDRLRNQIAFIFSDLKFDKAVSVIIKKSKHKELFNKNGSLLFALNDFDLSDYFIDLIEILCGHGYEARLTCYGFIEKLSKNINESIKKEAIFELNKYRNKYILFEDQQDQNSNLHFIEKTLELLSKV